MIFEFKSIAKPTNKELLAELRKTAKKLKTNYVTKHEYKQYGYYSVHTFVRRFGSWNKAHKLAGLDTNRSLVYFTNEMLMENLRRVWEKLGRQPHLRELRRPISEASENLYRKRFKSWVRTLEVFEKWLRKKGNAETKIIYTKYSVKIPWQGKPERKRKASRDVTYCIRYKVLKRDNYTCKRCKRSPVTHPGLQLEVDHIKPWSKTYDSSMRNLQTLCNRCNARKGNK